MVSYAAHDNPSQEPAPESRRDRESRVPRPDRWSAWIPGNRSAVSREQRRWSSAQHRCKSGAPAAVRRSLHRLVRGLGGCAASHIEGTRPARTFCVILASRPWVVVTVPALVLCARWLGWSRELATTSLVTGPVLIPFGRLHIFPSLPPPTAVVHLLPTLGGNHDTPQRLWP